MPKSLLDWFGVVCLWVGGVLFAFTTADAPLMPGAPTFLSADFWNFVPAILLTIAIGVFLYRQFRPVANTAPDGPAKQASPVSAETKAGREAAEMAAMLHNVVYAAGEARADARNERSAELAWPEVRSAMLTANKVKGIPMPSVTGKASLDLEATCRVLERVAPLIKRGHDDEARAAAADLVDRLNRAKGEA